jgi:3-hydroxyisobutyrate dehydrogenase-like beta-hydroxyacid dehydrogenase
MKVGFVGLGLMGSAMASNLLKAGHEVTVWNRAAGPAEILRSQGARVASTPEGAATGDVLLSALANDQAVREVILGGGLLEVMGRGMVHANHATISVELVKQLAAAHAERGIDYIAAPMFGRPEVAAAGKLNILTAGPPAAIERVRPLFEAMSSRIWPLGVAPECASVAKIAGNFMIFAAVEAIAEAAALTLAHGVKPADFIDLMTSTLFAAPIYQSYGRQIAEQRYEGGGILMSYKDVGLALAAGGDANLPLPLASLIRDSLLEAIAAGDEKLNVSALAKVAARRAHLPEGN